MDSATLFPRLLLLNRDLQTLQDLLSDPLPPPPHSPTHLSPSTSRRPTLSRSRRGSAVSEPAPELQASYNLRVSTSRRPSYASERPFLSPTDSGDREDWRAEVGRRRGSGESIPRDSTESEQLEAGPDTDGNTKRVGVAGPGIHWSSSTVSTEQPSTQGPGEEVVGRDGSRDKRGSKPLRRRFKRMMSVGKHSHSHSNTHGASTTAVHG